MIIIQNNNIRDWFEEELHDIDVSDPLKGYITSLLTEYHYSMPQISNCSLVLKYGEASHAHRFEDWQELGDWIFWSFSILPSSMTPRELCQNIGITSYRNCWRLLNCSWDLYDELAGDYERITNLVYESVGVKFDNTHLKLGSKV
jgi:hypothetical protein